MDDWMMCPICDAEMNHWRDHDNGVTTEEGFLCKNCGYIRQYAYGSFQVIVQGSAFEWSHCTPWEEIQ